MPDFSVVFQEMVSGFGTPWAPAWNLCPDLILEGEGVTGCGDSSPGRAGCHGEGEGFS